MVDPETVRRRVREIDRRVGHLRQLRGAGRAAFLDDVALQAQAERHLQLAIQSAIDIAMHIVADESPETPDSYGEAFRILARVEVIGDELAERLASAAGLRNVLVHGYINVDLGQVWDHLGRLDDLEALSGAVVDRLEE